MPIRDRIDPRVCQILSTMVRHGYEAHIVGGAVRDLLLGISPKDYDLATSARPEEVKRIFGRQARIIGRRFRLVHVYAGDQVYEVSTFRREPTLEERRGRETDAGVMLWRDNVFGSHEQDAVRRDFTVNAIYYDPIGERGIIDFVGGLEDLKAGVVRAIGDPALRLAEDPVRILRAIKLAARYGFTLKPDLREAIIDLSHRIRLSSQARVFEEVLKILAHPHTLSTLSLCREHGLLAHMWPRLDAVWDSPEGELTRRLLAARDRRVASGGYSRSKTLALSTTCVAAIAPVLGSPAPGQLWPVRAGLERECRDAIQAFFEPFRVPRFLSARIRDVLLSLPRYGGHFSRRLLRHPEYKYGLELFSLMAATCGWDEALVTRWPPPEARHEQAFAGAEEDDEPPDEEVGEGPEEAVDGAPAAAAAETPTPGRRRHRRRRPRRKTTS